MQKDPLVAHLTSKLSSFISKAVYSDGTVNIEYVDHAVRQFLLLYEFGIHDSLKMMKSMMVLAKIDGIHLEDMAAPSGGPKQTVKKRASRPKS